MMSMETIFAGRLRGCARDLDSWALRAAGHVATHYRHMRRTGWRAGAAFNRALQLPAAYLKGYGKGYGRPGGGVMGAPWESGATTLRWCEDTAAIGLRFCGWADECARLDHSGWFTAEDGWTGSTLRGGVWQLPGRDGQAHFVPGYAEFEGRGEMNPGSAALALKDVISCHGDDAEAGRRETAWRADGIAERVAESEREYDSAYQAGRRAAEADAEALEARTECRALLAEIRADRSAFTWKPAVCETLRSAIREALETISSKRAERDASWRDCASWAEDGWRSGFMDEADGGFARAVRLGFAKRSDWKGPPEDCPI